MLTESIAIGLVVGFLFYERVGFSPGGLVVPGYIALQWNQPLAVLFTLVIALIIYGLVRLMSEFLIVYSRRRFILMVLAGFAIQWLFDVYLQANRVEGAEIRPFAYIIPGLIANDIDRQRTIPTISSLLVVSVIVRFVLIALGYSP